MRTLALLLCLLTTTLLLRAQQITGRVIRSNSDTTIAGASVYFSGSTKGTITDAKGVFTLTVDGTKIPLVISCVGYYSTLVTDHKPGRDLTVSLKPKNNIMREVLIGSDGMSNADKLRIFKREFIGTSDNALNCTITNIEAIDLRYHRGTQTLTAFCNDPIIVKNKKLGYIITYYLDGFSWDRSHLRFVGNYFFKEDLPTDKKELAQVRAARETAYAGSRMQFVRSLWSNTLQKNGFEMYDNTYHNLTADSLLAVDPSAQKYIKINRTVRIAYEKNYAQITYLTKKEPLSFINKDGFYGAGLSWAGPMTKQRIGDLLPFEYVSVKEAK